MVSEHGAGARLVTPEELAREKREREIVLSKTSLILGGIVLLIGLGLTVYGANTFAILNCPLASSGPCLTPQSLVDQIRTSGFRAVYVGSQEAAYGGLLLVALGCMSVTFWGTRGLRLSQKIMLVLLVGVFLLVLVTALAIAAGFIPFGQRITFAQ